MTNEIQTQESFSLTPRSLEEAMKMAELLSNSQMVPKDYQRQPGNVLVAVQMGAELGLKPIQSLQNIAVVNGRPAVWGDGLRALIMSAPDLVDLKESYDPNTAVATCTIKRKRNNNVLEFTATFSRQQAEMAGLWGRNTWKAYPERMLQWRAFGYAARDAYADRLRGIQLAEEVQDIVDVNEPPRQPERDITPETAALPHYSQEAFDTNFPKWAKVVEAGKKTPDEIIATVSTKGQLTQSMIEQIKALSEGVEA